MKFLRLPVRLTAWLWPPLVGMLTITALLADEAQRSPQEAPGVHLTVGVLVVAAGVLAAVGPAFYWLGRWEARVGAIEQWRRDHVERNLEFGERIAVAIETLSASPITLNCPLGNCPNAKGDNG